MSRFGVQTWPYPPREWDSSPWNLSLRVKLWKWLADATKRSDEMPSKKKRFKTLLLWTLFPKWIVVPKQITPRSSAKRSLKRLGKVTLHSESTSFGGAPCHWFLHWDFLQFVLLWWWLQLFSLVDYVPIEGNSKNLALDKTSWGSSSKGMQGVLTKQVSDLARSIVVYPDRESKTQE